MIKRYIQILGFEDTLKLLEANEKPLNPTIRSNILKITPEKLKEKLAKKNFNLKNIEWVPYGFEVLS